MLAKYSAVVLYLVLMFICINLYEQLFSSRSIILLSTTTSISNTTRQKTITTENDTDVLKKIRITYFSKRIAHFERITYLKYALFYKQSKQFSHRKTYCKQYM